MNYKAILQGTGAGLLVLLIAFVIEDLWTEQEEIVRLDLIEGKQDLQTTQINELKAEYKESHAELKAEFKESHAELLKEISKLVDEVQSNDDRLDQTNSRVDQTNSRVDETNSRIDNINSNVAKVDSP